jgi:hypothetical protein
LREPSTYGGLSTIAAGAALFHLIPSGSSTDLVKDITMIGMGLGGLLAIVLPESGRRAPKAPGPAISPLAVLALAGFLALFGFGSARAADLAKKAEADATSTGVINQLCDQTQCQGFYAGFSLYGEGGNADIVQNGLNGSVFAGGGMLGGNVGWESWSNGYFIAAQFDALLASTSAADTTGFAPGGFVGLLHAKLGGSMSKLFGTSPAPQGAITVPTQLQSSLMAPYLDFCTAIRQGVTQWCGGAGAQFFISKRWTADLVYDYGAPTTKVNALQVVGLQADYHF